MITFPPVRFVSTWFALCLLAAGFFAPGSPGEEPPLREPDLAIGLDVTEVRTGHLEVNARAERQSLAAPVAVTIQNRSNKTITTSAEITGRDRASATAELVKTEDSPNGQILHLQVLGHSPTFDDSEVLLTITLKEGDTVRATKSLPVKVCVPTLLKLHGDVLYEGPAQPGLVNRALNMRTVPKAAVSHPEARLASMCLHDITLTVLDQYGDPLPAIYDKAPVWAALGKSDYETTNRTLRENSTFLDSVGFWQFVGGVSNMTIDPDRAEVQKFLSSPPPPCTDKQYATYEPLIVQYQVGGYPVGSYQRQVTLKDSGDDHQPIMKIIFNPVSEPTETGPLPR